MRMGNHARLLSATALAAISALYPCAAEAQTATQPEAVTSSAATTVQSDLQTGDVIVTGTRVVRNGYKAPNPTTVLGSAEIAAKAPVSIADFVNELPALQGSISPRANQAGVSAGNNGINALNLRNLGVNRTLVLLDGQRVGAASLGGYVDIDQFPQALVKRVDVVTGGASADWGSDAVAGVVNFVLDRDFTGVKGEAQGGVTTYGDNRNYKVSLTAGTKFADGRGHILISGELANSDQIKGIGSRDWYKYSKVFANPAYAPGNGLPAFLVRSGAGFTSSTPGGIITNTALRGIYFGPGGAPAQFNYGSLVSGDIMVGGQYKYSDWATTGNLEPKTGHQNLFGYIGFDITDHVQAFAQLSYGRSTYFTNWGILPFDDAVNSAPAGQAGGISVNNPYLPTSVYNQAIAAGVTSFDVGSWLQDFGELTVKTRRTSIRPVIGLRGDFDAFGEKFTWDLSGESTISHSYIEARTVNTGNLAAAVDAVRAPNGSIVCRSTLSSPNNGCVPYNVFGTGVNTQAAVDYITGNPWLRTRLKQDVVSANLRGNPFSTWAGPVSVALGVEHRREKVSGTADAIDLASQATSIANGTPRVKPYYVGNYLPTFGSYHVTEAYFQAVVPLAKEMAFAKSLDLLVGVRGTDYSTSGYVTTWKAGLTYKPVDDITFRLTRSRDIRAPNLGELFRSPQATASPMTDPFHGNLNVNPVPYQVTSGNPNLKPEKADSTGVGVVLQPHFLPGLSASVDYWNVRIKGAIGTLVAQQVVNQCFSGNSARCSQITRNSNGLITNVDVLPVNLNKQTVRGLDFEASYQHPLLGGSLQLRGLATHYLKNLSENGINAPVSLLGKNQGNNADGTTLPRWSYNATVGWNNDALSLQLTARGFSRGVYDPSFVQCTTGCPVSTGDHPTIENNRLPGATYFDAYGSFAITRRIETFVAVDNFLNKDPGTVPWTSGGPPIDIDRTLYDALGRTFRVGVRFKM